jgi:heptosyltransferase-3
MTSVSATSRILIIRRDNIGDLVCTTPLIRALRTQLPDAWIAALVTRYNEAVLADNTDLDAVFSYTKAKHRRAGESRFAIYASRLKTILALRRRHFDWVLLPGGYQASSLRFARWIAPRQILMRDAQDAVAGPHEVEQCCHLLTRMGLTYQTPAPRLKVDPTQLARLSPNTAGTTKPRHVVAFHISARKPSQRWSAQNFAALAQRLYASRGTAFLLLWAPGASNDALHPGDDDKAQEVLAATTTLPLTPIVTGQLSELIAALAQSDEVICCDGGAMHLAAALGKPIVSLFGHSDAQRWRPWGVPHVVLQKPSHNVADVTVDEVYNAYLQLIGE